MFMIEREISLVVCKVCNIGDDHSVTSASGAEYQDEQRREGERHHVVEFE